jgi:DNA mismatch repair protein MutL
VGKPDTAKKTRGDQYIFVNNRYIRSGYLNHAIMNAYQELIPADSYPLYVLFIDMDPETLDINVHPTKQEIKFADEKIVYAFIQAAVKHALAQYSVMPTLDFELDPQVQQLDAISKPFTEEKQQTASSSQLYRSFTQKHQAHFIEKSSGLKDWKEFYGESRVQESQPLLHQETAPVSTVGKLEVDQDAVLVQMQKTFILVTTNRGFIVVNQQLDHERILFERFTDAAQGKAIAAQRSLFPSSIELTPADAVMLEELLADLSQLGYLIEPFGTHSYVIQGTPADVEQGNEKQVIENLLEQYKHFTSEIRFSKREKLIRTMVSQRVVRPGRVLDEKEMKGLVDDLFACRQPNTTPDGSPTYIEFRRDALLRMFNQ